MTSCPGCGDTVITTPNGRHLNPTKSLVGRWLPDGTELTPNEQRNPTIRAHFPHQCPPTTTPTTPASAQDALF